MICKNCNAEIDNSSVFCINCGTPVEIEKPKHQPTYQQPQPAYQPPQPAYQPSTYQQPQAPMYQPQQPAYQPQYQPPQQPAYQTPVYEAPQQTYQAPVYQPNYAAANANAPVRKIGFGEACKLFFQNYANFNGRATRSEFW